MKSLKEKIATGVLLGLVLLNIGSYFWSPRASDSKTYPERAETNFVTLQAAPGNNTVQMFERVGPGDEGAITQLPDGAHCSIISGPTTVVIEGISMRFYRLTCSGNIGYVNARWVRE